MSDLKKRLYQILEASERRDRMARWFSVVMTLLIMLNIVAVMADTVNYIHLRCAQAFWVFEVISVALFTFEYVLHLWVCTEDERYKHPVWGRLRHTLTPMALVDLASVVPFYLPWLIQMDLRVLWSLRLLRVLRVVKLGRYSEPVRIIVDVVKAKREELGVAAFAGVVLLIMGSTVMFYLEREEQPEVFTSIPASMWWGVATLTTVGYGDIYPVTPAGKVLGSLMAFMGIGMFALPAGLFAEGFSHEIRRRRQGAQTCPHCGKALEPK